MKWTKLTLETTAEAEDLVSNMLSEIGISSIEISDNVPLSEEDRKKLFIDFLPELNEEDHTAFVSFYIDVEEDIEALLSKVREGLKELSEYTEVGRGVITVSETEDLDWINNWKEFFKPFYVDDNILIKPTWEELPNVKAGDLVIEIDPGTSFGTGSHETTKLAIIGLKKHMQPDSVLLDAGSGSGILSIIAKKLGAKEVLGIDIDPIATEAALENAIVNHMEIVKENLSFHTGNMIEDDGIRSLIGRNKYDIVVANILADVIIPLSEVIGDNMKSGGIFISSGIINTKEKEVEAALLKNNFTIIEVNRMNDWVSFVAKNDKLK